MSDRLATCACGQIRVSCVGEPVRVSMCHCLQCQKRTGSLFGVAAFFDRANVSVIAGKATKFVRSADSGNLVSFHFCPTCGSTVWIEPENRPNLVAITVGAFADPTFPKPVQSVWTDCKHEWFAIPDDMKIFELAAGR